MSKTDHIDLTGQDHVPDDRNIDVDEAFANWDSFLQDELAAADDIPNADLDHHKFTVTFFDDQKAYRPKSTDGTLPQLLARILKAHAPTKDRLPWLKLAKFGELKSKNKSYRHDANVELISGVEFDYDSANISLDQAVETLQKLNVATLIYTSAFYTPTKPKW